MCNKCSNCGCSDQGSVTRQINIINDSIGRDGESAYEIYVRLGGTLTEEEYADLPIPSFSNTGFTI